MLKEIRQEAVVKSGGIIELTVADLPVGTAVEVTILLKENNGSSKAVSQEEKWARFYAVLGAWKDDDDIERVFAEIDRDRHLDRSSEMPIFDD